MPSSFERDLYSEAEYLKQASRYVGFSQHDDAIALLQSARQLVPVTNRLLNALGKLYLTVGKPGGLSAAVLANGLNGSAIVCPYLRWRNSVGVRQRQELLAWQVDSTGMRSKTRMHCAIIPSMVF